jgi:Uma2 family endonuclease
LTIIRRMAIIINAMTIITEITTAEQLFQHPDLGRCELIGGELFTMSPSGSLHGKITAFLGAVLYKFVEPRKLGIVFGAETGFHISHDPDTVRAPDVSFVCAQRIPDPLPQGYFPGPPDLAVEVLSPNDRSSEVQAKIRDWLNAGCSAVWLVDPQNKSITVYKKDADVAVLKSSDTLSDAQLLPGFSITVGKIFE